MIGHKNCFRSDKDLFEASLVDPIFHIVACRSIRSKSLQIFHLLFFSFKTTDHYIAPPIYHSKLDTTNTYYYTFTNFHTPKVGNKHKRIFMINNAHKEHLIYTWKDKKLLINTTNTHIQT